MKTASDLQSPRSFPIGVHYGIFLGLIYIVFELIRLSTGTHYRTTTPHLVFRATALAVITILALYHLSRKNGAQGSIKTVVIIGLGIGVTTSLLFILYNFILTTFIEPDYYATYSEVFRPHHIRLHPNLTPEQVDADVKAGLLSLREVSIIAVVSTTIGAVVLALCSYLVMKRSVFSKKSGKGSNL